MNKQTSILGLVLLLLILATGCGMAQQAAQLNKDPVPFGKATNAPWLVIKPSNNGVPNKIDTTSDASGVEVVEYTAKREGPEFIAHPVPLSGFSKIRFRVWSQDRTMLVIILEDGDKAKFHATVPVEGDRWTDVSLGPSDFQINDDSPVKKQALDAQIISSPFILVDAGFMMGQKSPNTIKLSDFRTEQGKTEPATSLEVPQLIDGKTVTVDRSGTINHNVFVRNGGKLVVTAPSLHIAGNIRVENAALEVHHCSLVMDNKFSHQLTLGFTNSDFLLDGVEFSSPFMSNLFLKNSHLAYRNCRFHNNGFTCAPEKSTIDLDDVSVPGEWVVEQDCHFNLRHCRGTLLWLALGLGQKADLSLPHPPTHVDKFALPAETKLDVSIADSDMILWALVTKPGCDVTIHDSDIRAAGMAFGGNRPGRISNIKDKVSHLTTRIGLPDRKLQFVNCNVEAFCFYPMIDSHLEVSDSVFGELNAFKNAEVVIRDSICDGSGGYILAADNCKVRLVNCTLNCPVVTVNDGKLVLEHCQVNGDTSAADNSTIQLVGTKLHGSRQQLGNGRIEEGS